MPPADTPRDHHSEGDGNGVTDVDGEEVTGAAARQHHLCHCSVAKQLENKAGGYSIQETLRVTRNTGGLQATRGVTSNTRRLQAALGVKVKTYIVRSPQIRFFYH